MKACKSRPLIGIVQIVLFFCGVSSYLFGGLQLFSYQDDRGQTIVVDSVDRIPEKYRDQVQADYIPSFNNYSESSDSSENEKSDENKNKSPVVAKHSGELVADDSESISEENPAIASATLFMNQIKDLQLNNERVHLQALARGVTFPAVRHFHLSNIIALQKVIAPESIDIDGTEGWKAHARRVLEQIRSLQFTVSRWLDTSSEAIIKAMPPLLAQLKEEIRKLDEELAPIIAAEKAKYANEKVE